MRRETPDTSRCPRRHSRRRRGPKGSSSCCPGRTAARGRSTRPIDPSALALAYGRSALTSSPTVWKRRDRSFSRQRRMAASISTGTSGRSSRTGTGASAMMLARSPATVSARNGGRAVSTSCRQTPSDQMSVRKSTRLALRICSGDMYVGEPNVARVFRHVRVLRAGALHRLGDADVEDLHHPRAVRPAGEEHVGRLDVAVDDAERVRLGDARARLAEVVDGVGHREDPARLHELRQVLALEHLHDDVRRAGGEIGDVEHPHHVVALDAVGALGLEHEAVDGLVVGGGGRPEELDGDRVVEEEVAGGHDDAHAAGSEAALDEVLAGDDLADDRKPRLVRRLRCDRIVARRPG